MPMIQKSVNKWFPRALEMFGDERGGDSNIRMGFKDLKNREAQDQYIEEVRRMMRDINARFLRARFPDDAPEKIEAALDEMERSRGRYRGVEYDELLRIPDRRFFRRKGEPAFSMVGVDGETYETPTNICATSPGTCPSRISRAATCAITAKCCTWWRPARFRSRTAS